MISGCEKRAPNQTHLQFDLLRGRLVRPFSRSVVEKLLANVLHESLERKSAIPVEPPEIQSTNSTESLTNKLIMVAEDNPANQQLAMVQLKRLGYRVITVSTGAQAVDELAHRYEDYALVLMDVQMPEMDGYQAARLIRKGEAASGGHIPIVAMTANVLHDDRQACLEAGMDAYVPKPVLLEDLRKVIAHCLQGGEMPRIAEPRLADLISETVQLDERILADLRSLNQPDKPDFFEQLVGLYLDDSKSLMDTIHAAAEGKDSESLRKAIHSMKGISSNLGAARLSQLCWQVENSIRNNLPLDQDWLTLFENEYASTCDALKRSVLQSNQ
jgi:CheY-like chemotaxis protein/HPt (histidine-containing phosphotransfer) domain-containing protein